MPSDVIGVEMLRIAKELQAENRLTLFMLAILRWYDLEGLGSEEELVAFLEREVEEQRDANT